jgi:hypothetical protein
VRASYRPKRFMREAQFVPHTDKVRKRRLSPHLAHDMAPMGLTVASLNPRSPAIGLLSRPVNAGHDVSLSVRHGFEAFPQLGYHTSILAPFPVARNADVYGF